jgi:hypothetical protein
MSAFVRATCNSGSSRCVRTNCAVCLWCIAVVLTVSVQCCRVLLFPTPPCAAHSMHECVSGVRCFAALLWRPQLRSGRQRLVQFLLHLLPNAFLQDLQITVLPHIRLPCSNSRSCRLCCRSRFIYGISSSSSSSVTGLCYTLKCAKHLLQCDWRFVRKARRRQAVLRTKSRLHCWRRIIGSLQVQGQLQNSRKQVQRRWSVLQWACVQGGAVCAC